MLSEAHPHQVWAVASKHAAATRHNAAPYTHSKMACSEVAQAAPGSSPSSNASCGMDFASMPATPVAAKEQQSCGAHPQAVISYEGWFAKCRGCGCMTAHEKFIKDADVPFCRRCQHTLTTACPAMQQKMVDTLLYVHHAWSNAGL